MLPLNVPPQAAADLINFVTNVLTDPRVAQGLPPFTRPTLRSQLMPPTCFVYGPGSAGTGGRIPAFLAEVPANLGNQDFKVGVSNARGGALATLVLNLLPANTQIGGVNLNVGLNGSELLVTTGLGGALGVAGEGYGTLALGLPAAPFLAGITLFGQWFVWDGGVPAAAATSRGAEIRFF